MDYTVFVFPRNTKGPTRQAPQIVRPWRDPTQAFPLVDSETFLPDVFMLGIDHTRLHWLSKPDFTIHSPSKLVKQNH